MEDIQSFILVLDLVLYFSSEVQESVISFTNINEKKKTLIKDILLMLDEKRGVRGYHKEIDY